MKESMKVRELIEALSKVDPELDVLLLTPSHKENDPPECAFHYLTEVLLEMDLILIAR